LSQAAIIAVGEIARNGQLIYDSQEIKLNIVDLLIKKLHTSKETNKLKEKAAASLGFMCIHEPISNEFTYKIEETLINRMLIIIFDCFLTLVNLTGPTR